MQPLQVTWKTNEVYFKEKEADKPNFFSFNIKCGLNCCNATWFYFYEKKQAKNLAYVYEDKTFERNGKG